MSTEELNKLLNKYFEGDTSLEEEKRLKALFNAGDVPEEFLPFKVHFSFLENERPSMKVDPFAKIEQDDTRVEATIIPIHSKRKRILWFTGVAASIIIIMGVVFQLNRYVNKVEDIYSDPEVAYMQAKDALLYVSSKFNSGADKLQSIDKVNDGVNSLKQVGKFEDGIEQSQKFTKYNKLDKVIGTSN